VIALIPTFLLVISGICGNVFGLFRIAKYGAIFSCLAFLALLFLPTSKIIIDWFEIGKLNFGFAFQFGLTEILICIVMTAILICLYFAEEVDTIDKLAKKKFGILNIFASFMCITISSQNLFQFYFGIEGLGLISSILVNLEKDSHIQSSKVFSFNKFASLLFLIAIFLITMETKNFDFIHIKMMCENQEQSKLFVPACILLISCLCKGAQLPFTYWLVDNASRANVFASILIHSGTIVTVGIIFIAKCSFIFACFPIFQKAMVVIGTFTAFWMACNAIIYNNTKKIIACLTASSAGFMFITCGIGEYSLAILYLSCHALAKSVLFLCFAYLMFATSGEKNLFNMIGIGKITPKIKNIIFVAISLNVGFPFVVNFFPKISFNEYLVSHEMYLLMSISVVINIIAMIAILRMVAIPMYGKFCSKSVEMKTILSKKYNEFNMIAVWTLIIMSILSSFTLWSTYESGRLYLGVAEATSTLSVKKYIIGAIIEIIQIVIAIMIAIIFARNSKSKINMNILKFLTIMSGHNRVCETFCLVNQKVAIYAVRLISEFDRRIISTLHIKIFKWLHFTNFVLSKKQKKSLESHVLWVWFGLIALVMATLLGKL
jgi:NADH:ubiquinone oxidoreductase subunit 5 (subunit L)/multisubunit Na+/H+ antiporter MnhA subunit